MLGRPPSLEGQVPGRGPPRRGSETRNQGPSWKRTPGRAQAETRLLSVSSQVASGDTCAPTWEACPQTQAGVPPAPCRRLCWAGTCPPGKVAGMAICRCNQQRAPKLHF